MRLPLKKLANTTLLGSLLLGLSASYVVKSEASPAGAFPFARIEEACGPTDGIAFQIYLTAKETECGPVKEPFLSISVNEPIPKSAPRNYSFREGDRDAGAARCLRAGACESAASGILRLTEIQPGKSVSGEYEIRFANGRAEKARFEAKRCEVRLLCG